MFLSQVTIKHFFGLAFVVTVEYRAFLQVHTRILDFQVLLKAFFPTISFITVVAGPGLTYFVHTYSVIPYIIWPGKPSATNVTDVPFVGFT